MVNGKILFCLVLVSVWCKTQSASLPFLPPRLGDLNELPEPGPHVVTETGRIRVREGVPPPLCARRCMAPPAGPVCAFDAAGKARTFATLCELEAVSCHESTYYAITSLGEC